MTFRVLLIGGGSGGHVYPLVAVANALKRQGVKAGMAVEVKLMGDGPFVKRAAEENGLSATSLIAPKLRRYTSVANATDWLKAPFALIQVLWKLFWYMPDAVFAKGGYTSAFPALVARLYAIPLYLHESDSVPGLTNKVLAKRARLVFTAFPSATQALSAYPTKEVGNPIRRGLAGVEKTKALVAFKLVSDKPTVLILGGSQGARQINDVILDGLVEMVNKGYQIIHQCGDAHYAALSDEVEKIVSEGGEAYAQAVAERYRLYPFLDQDELATAYAACDVAVTRASANVLTELAALGKPMVMVPLASAAQNHQFHNASALIAYGNILIEGANLTPHLLMAELAKLLKPETHQKVSEAERAFAHLDAADVIARTILNV
jgi:UDP-N-acetylglucosamine--N-acetylmuramyl-(pentapeptide) pyrophosphoryl-undecaprenol N-acetylglucosamine transferase